MKRAIGLAMLAAPFVVIFVALAWKSGLLVALGLFGGIGLLMFWIRVALGMVDD